RRQIVRRTSRSLVQKATSMVNIIPTECTERAGRRRMAPSTPSRPSRPCTRSWRVSATSSAASTSPSRSSHAGRITWRPAPGAGSYVEADLEGVAVGDLVVLSLDAEPSGVLGILPRHVFQQIVPTDDPGPDVSP